MQNKELIFPDIQEGIFTKYVNLMKVKVDIAHGNYATKEWELLTCNHGSGMQEIIDQLMVDYNNAIDSTVEEIRKVEKYNDEVIKTLEHFLKRYLINTTRYYKG